MAAMRALVLAVMVVLFPATAFCGGPANIGPDRVYSLMKEGSGMWLVDVRGPAAYGECHIEGSINIPLEELRLKSLPKEKLMILVDDSLGSMKAEEAARELGAKGMGKVYVLEGGLYGWASSGRPLAGDAARAHTPVAVTPEDLRQASERGIRMKVYDLRGVRDAGIPGSEKVEGKDVDERVGRLLAELTKSKDKGLASKLKKPLPIVLIFPAASDAFRAASMVSRTGNGDVRYLTGEYEAEAAGGSKTVSINTGGCPTCPKSRDNK